MIDYLKAHKLIKVLKSHLSKICELSSKYYRNELRICTIQGVKQTKFQDDDDLIRIVQLATSQTPKKLARIVDVPDDITSDVWAGSVIFASPPFSANHLLDQETSDHLLRDAEATRMLLKEVAVQFWLAIPKLAEEYVPYLNADWFVIILHIATHFGISKEHCLTPRLKLVKQRERKRREDGTISGIPSISRSALIDEFFLQECGIPVEGDLVYSELSIISLEIGLFTATEHCLNLFIGILQDMLSLRQKQLSSNFQKEFLELHRSFLKATTEEDKFRVDLFRLSGHFHSTISEKSHKNSKNRKKRCVLSHWYSDVEFADLTKCSGNTLRLIESAGAKMLAIESTPVLFTRILGSKKNGSFAFSGCSRYVLNREPIACFLRFVFLFLKNHNHKLYSESFSPSKFSPKSLTYVHGVAQILDFNMAAAKAIELTGLIPTDSYRVMVAESYNPKGCVFLDGKSVDVLVNEYKLLKMMSDYRLSGQPITLGVLNKVVANARSILVRLSCKDKKFPKKMIKLKGMIQFPGNRGKGGYALK